MKYVLNLEESDDITKIDYEYLKSLFRQAGEAEATDFCNEYSFKWLIPNQYKKREFWQNKTKS
jgi:hypothetical protein